MSHQIRHNRNILITSIPLIDSGAERYHASDPVVVIDEIFFRSLIFRFRNFRIGRSLLLDNKTAADLAPLGRGAGSAYFLCNFHDWAIWSVLSCTSITEWRISFFLLPENVEGACAYLSIKNESLTLSKKPVGHGIGGN